MNLRSAVGITMLAGCPIAWFLAFWLVVPQLAAQFYGSVPEYTYYSILYGPFSLLVIAGLIVYASGRREFWQRAHEYQYAPFFFLGIGLALSILGSLFSLAGYSSMLYYTWKPPGRQLDQLLVSYSPGFLLFALWVISGITLTTEGIKALRLEQSLSMTLPPHE